MEACGISRRSFKTDSDLGRFRLQDNSAALEPIDGLLKDPARVPVPPGDTESRHVQSLQRAVWIEVEIERRGLETTRAVMGNTEPAVDYSPCSHARVNSHSSR